MIWKFLQPIMAAGDTYVVDPAISEESARAWWMRPADDGRTVVACAPDGTVTGTAELCRNHGGPGAHIANASFLVDPAYGAQGIGRALVEHVIEACRADGYRGIQFNAVAASNRHAVRLYERVGFTTVATIPGGFHHPTEGYVGLHIMYLDLT